MKENMSKSAVLQNLEDAGCGKDTITKFMASLQKGDQQGQVRVLERHRSDLLDKVHEEEKKISCLDYLVYQIKHDKVRKEGGR